MYALTGKSLNLRQFINYSYPELRLTGLQTLPGLSFGGKKQSVSRAGRFMSRVTKFMSRVTKFMSRVREFMARVTKFMARVTEFIVRVKRSDYHL
jgi:hypothetical protein